MKPVEWLAALLSGDVSKEEKEDAVHRLQDMVIQSVHLVDRGANKRRFNVVKRGEDMPGVKFGEDVVDQNGELSPVLEDVAKGAGAQYAQKLAALASALGQLADKAKGMSDEDYESAKADMGKMCMQYAKQLAGMSGYDMQMAEKAAPKDDEEDEKKKAQKAKKKPEDEDDEDLEKSEEAATIVAESGLPKDVADVLMESVAKAGAAMKGARLAKFKSIVADMVGLLKELQPSDQKRGEKLIEAAFGKLSKRMDAQTEHLGELVGLLKTAKSPAAAPAPKEVPEGQAVTETPAQQPVAKSDEDDDSWCGKDLNNPQLFKETADEDTYFGA